MGQVLRALEAEVLSGTGVAITLCGKTLDGSEATEWPTRMYASSAPEGPAGDGRAYYDGGGYG